MILQNTCKEIKSHFRAFSLYILRIQIQSGPHIEIPSTFPEPNSHWFPCLKRNRHPVFWRYFYRWYCSSTARLLVIW